MRDSRGVFYGPVHGAEEGTAVLHQAVKVDFLKEVALRLAEVVRVKPTENSKRLYVISN